MIVVLDTNGWISALVFARQHGTPTRALAKAMSEDVIASCDEIEYEVFRVLTEKFFGNQLAHFEPWMPFSRDQFAQRSVEP